MDAAFRVSDDCMFVLMEAIKYVKEWVQRLL